jgi:HD-like signal output (HDOD) protein/CheY-like chemotaxis protein
MADKKRLLFVDDEPKVLDGIRRMLHSMHLEWDISCAGSGQEALDAAAAEPFDVIVSDMRMPGMDGSALLNELRKRYPQTARIALSGQTKKEDILRAVGPVNQFLSKPCDAETLTSTISQALALRDLLADDRLRGLLSQMDAMPVLPSLYDELLEELESPDASLKVVERIVSQDIGMSAKILQLVNSAFFGVRQHVASPGQAVALLGLDTVKSLVLSINVFSQFEGTRVKGFSLDALWRHSMNVAGFAKTIATAEKAGCKTADHAFIAGLLHDVGKLAFAAKLPAEYAETLALAMSHGTTLHEAERTTLQATHAELGAYLLGLWGFSDPIVEALVFHHEAAKCPVREFGTLTAVHVANVLEHETSTEGGTRAASRLDEAYVTDLGLAERLSDWKKVCREILEEEKAE